MSEKFCKDCMFMNESRTCQHKKANVKTDTYLVDGNFAQQWCAVMRMESGFCGPDGKLWEAK